MRAGYVIKIGRGMFVQRLGKWECHCPKTENGAVRYQDSEENHAINGRWQNELSHIYNKAASDTGLMFPGYNCVVSSNALEVCTEALE